VTGSSADERVPSCSTIYFLGKLDQLDDTTTLTFKQQYYSAHPVEQLYFAGTVIIED
jgi:hypothetical protein